MLSEKYIEAMERRLVSLDYARVGEETFSFNKTVKTRNSGSCLRDAWLK